MKLFSRLALAGLMLAGAATVQPAIAAGERVNPPELTWSFAGPFGRYDRAQLQRGLKVFKESCANCHSANLFRFRNIADLGYSDAQVKAFAAEFKIKDGPNEQGEMFERPGRPADAWPAPFPNEQAARAANGGAYPPDFSVLAKARNYERGFPWFVFDIFTQYQEGGVDYIAALLKGYEDPPKGVELQPGQYWNKYMPGHLIAMPPPINPGQVEYPKGPDGRPPVPETVQQYAYDVTAFMMWLAEPKLEERKRTGLFMMPLLIVLALLLYFSKKRIWSRLPEHSHA